MAFVEKGRDYSVEPTIEECTFDMRLDNTRINAARAALHLLKTKLGDFATNPESASMYKYLIGEVANVDKIKQIETAEDLAFNSPKPPSKN